jgi:3-dehydroquinate synthetase/predicted NBD/HSP70 family sugar kinase
MERVFKMSFESLITYQIKRVSDLFDVTNPALADYIKTKKAFCMVDKNLADQSSSLKAYFQTNDIEAHYFFVDVSEKNKNIQSIIDFTSFCFKHEIGRRDPVIAFGGGIVCDLVGMSANLLRRGTPCIKIPTTLCGIIDAGVGIKNGVNYAGCKNSLGTFYPPMVVFIDLEFLSTLPEKDMKNGLVEMIKIVALKDRATWSLLKKNINKLIVKDFDLEVVELIDRSIAFMIEELRENLLEDNLYRIVDYGHEFGHLIEVITDYELSHGESVGIGMRLSNNIAYRQGLMDANDHKDFNELFNKLNLPYWHESLSCQKLYAKRDGINRHKGGDFSIVALHKIGDPFFIKTMSLTDLEHACSTLNVMEPNYHSSNRDDVGYVTDALVFDIGGTNLRAGRYSLSEQKLISIKKKNTPNSWNMLSEGSPYDALIKEMTELGKSLFPGEEPGIVTIGFPGPITPAGEILSTPTIWGDQFKGSASLISYLQSFWPHSKVNVINDVSAAGYFLKDQYTEDFCVITVSSGIGSKLFINGKPYTGAMGRGGEIGHWVTDTSDEALTCECGGKGHLGGISSGRGALAHAKMQAKLEPNAFKISHLGRTRPNYTEITNEALVTAYSANDEWAKTIIDKTAKQLAKAIALIHTTTGMELFIIIGGFSIALGETYRKSIADFAGDFCWDLGQNWNEMIKIGPNETEMGLIGAGIFSNAVKNSTYESR